MPGRDGTGPIGFGAMTGRGVGFGYRCRRYCDVMPSELTERELLSVQKNLLEARLNTINKHLDRSKETEK